MKTEELDEILAERPFIPIRLHMSNGRTHEIRHPELAIVGEDVIGIEREDSRPRLRFVSIPHINEVQHVADSASTGSGSSDIR